jgi:hypothetical protein
MPFRKTIAVCYENDTKHINAPYGNNAEFLFLKQVVYIVTTVL